MPLIALALLTSLGLGSPPPAAAQLPSPSAGEWQRLLDSMVEDILALHPDPFAKIGELTFRRAVRNFQYDLPSLTPEQRLVRLMQLVASIGDGHTVVELKDEAYSLWYPIRLYEFSDGFFVTTAHASVADLAGAQVIEIAGRPVAEVVGRARTLFGADNALDRQERLYAVHNAHLMKGLGYSTDDGALELLVRIADGERRVRLEPVHGAPVNGPGSPVFDWHFYPEVYGLFGEDDEWISAFRRTPAKAFRTEDPTRPPFLGHLVPYYRRAIESEGVLYLQLNQTDDTRFLPFVRDTLETADALRPEHFIIDLRNNFGGDGSIAGAMIREFIRRQPDTPWKNLYVVTGRKTFSAAMAVLQQLVEHTNHTLIGEPPGAPFNFFGDTVSRPVPELGLSLDVSALRHQMRASNDLAEFVPVDIPAVFSFADYLAGRDPAVDPILAGREMRGLTAIALADGGAAARTAYKERLPLAERFSWWTPTPEIALRRACDELLRLGRAEDALETCRLNTEIHPTIWNTWYNLGGAFYSLERFPESYGPFRCVVVMEPTNWNVPGIRRYFERRGVDSEQIELPAGCPIRG